MAKKPMKKSFFSSFRRLASIRHWPCLIREHKQVKNTLLCACVQLSLYTQWAELSYFFHKSTDLLISSTKRLKTVIVKNTLIIWLARWSWGESELSDWFLNWLVEVPYDKLLTYLACSSHAGEYWPSVILVGTSLSSVRAATTSGQYSTVRPPSLVSKKLLCMAKDETKEICEDSETNVFVVKWEKKRCLLSQLRQYLHFHHSNPKSKQASNFSSQYHHWITR